MRFYAQNRPFRWVRVPPPVLPRKDGTNAFDVRYRLDGMSKTLSFETQARPSGGPASSAPSARRSAQTHPRRDDHGAPPSTSGPTGTSRASPASRGRPSTTTASTCASRSPPPSAPAPSTRSRRSASPSGSTSCRPVRGEDDQEPARVPLRDAPGRRRRRHHRPEPVREVPPPRVGAAGDGVPLPRRVPHAPRPSSRDRTGSWCSSSRRPGCGGVRSALKPSGLRLARRDRPRRPRVEALEGPRLVRRRAEDPQVPPHDLPPPIPHPELRNHAKHHASTEWMFVNRDGEPWRHQKFYEDVWQPAVRLANGSPRSTPPRARRPWDQEPRSTRSGSGRASTHSGTRTRRGSSPTASTWSPSSGASATSRSRRPRIRVHAPVAGHAAAAGGIDGPNARTAINRPRKRGVRRRPSEGVPMVRAWTYG
jgi:hypothetical protein